MAKEYFYCPNCKSDDISAGEIDAEMHFREVVCYECNYYWYEQYTLLANYDNEWTELEDPE